MKNKKIQTLTKSRYMEENAESDSNVIFILIGAIGQILQMKDPCRLEKNSLVNSDFFGCLREEITPFLLGS